MNQRKNAIEKLIFLVGKIVKNQKAGTVMINRKVVDVELSTKPVSKAVIEEKCTEIVDHIIEECLGRMRRELDYRMSQHINVRHTDRPKPPRWAD